MTPAEKAKETRRKHEEQRLEKEQEKKQITDIMVTVLLSILKNCTASIDQKLEAVAMLLEIKGW